MKKIKFLLLPLLTLVFSSCGNNTSTSSITQSSTSTTSTTSEVTTTSSKPAEPLKFQTYSGSFDYSDYGASSKSTNGFALITNRNFSTGTYKMNVKSGGSGSCGLVFGSKANPESYYFYCVDSSSGNQIKLIKHTSSGDSLLGSCYITAGYNKDSTNEYKVVYDSGKIQCFFNNKLYISRTDSQYLTGTKVGIKTAHASSSFEGISILTNKEFNEVNTLIIGHSYMELWSNYKTDLSRYPDIFNIGIGGTASNDWVGHVNEIVDYKPTKLIYMIGINDVPRQGVTPSSIMNNISSLLNELLTKLPNLKIALVSINQCPTHVDYKASIVETNRLIWNYVYETDNVYLANVDNAFLKQDGTPDGSCFVDGLHPTAASYLVIRDAIYDAFDNKNQPDKPKDSDLTLIIGHSYMDNWKANCAKDLSRYSNVQNIGVGATNSMYWVNNLDKVLSYKPSKLIYMIGINDIPHEVENRTLYEQVKCLILGVHESLPNTKICLLSVNDVPLFHDEYKTKIDEANIYYKKIAFDFDYVYYGNLDNAFKKADGTPDESKFMETGGNGLHPKLEHYDEIVTAIYDAFDNKNQPKKEDITIKVDDVTYDLNSGKSLISEFNSNKTSSNWDMTDNIVKINNPGSCHSETKYEYFSIVFDFNRYGPKNPYFDKVAELGFLFGGSFNGNLYTGYALNIGVDWIEIVYINGSSSYTCTFVDGVNVCPLRSKFKFTVDKGVATLTYGDGANIKDWYQSKTKTVSLPLMKESNIYLFNTLSAQTICNIYEIKKIDKEPEPTNYVSDLISDFNTSTKKSAGVDWSVDTSNNKVTTTTTGGCILSSTTYKNFELTLSLDKTKASNPYFNPHSFEEGILIGSSYNDGKITGYGISYSSDWLEIVRIDSTDHTCTFIDGWNVKQPTARTIKFVVNSGVISALNADGTSIASTTFAGNTSISLSQYVESSIGIISYDNESSVYGFQKLNK